MSQVDVYPSPNIPTQSSSHSNGSFAPVLIVLAVIFVLVIFSVVLGRICNRRYHKEQSNAKVGSHGKGKKSKQNKDKFHHHHHHDHHHQSAGEGDLEFGFDKRFASAKIASNGDHFNFKVPKMPHNGGGGGGGGGGEHKGPAVRFADDHIEFRTGA